MTITDPTVQYYDSDYPDPNDPVYSENCSCFKEYPLLGYDGQRFISYAIKHRANRVLEVCCGTGRIAIPMAKSGLHVSGIDCSAEMLSLFKQKHSNQQLENSVDIFHANAQDFDLSLKNFDLSIIAFNGFLCLGNEQIQRAALKNIRRHLSTYGRLVMDILNPKYICLQGSSSFRAGPTRRCIYTGETYIRHSRSTSIDNNQVQQIYGYYQNLCTKNKHNFSFTWRPVYPSQLIEMLTDAGFSSVNLYGDSHRTIEFQDESQHIFVEAIV